MSKSSNQKRFQLSKKCREALAAHIYHRLQLVVAPKRVRLQPRPEDGYAWSVTKANAALLKSNLSSGKITFYRKILTELGTSLEAVSPQWLDMSQSNACGLPESYREELMDSSFTAEICELKAAKSRVEVELARTRCELDVQVHESHALRDEASQLRHDKHILELENGELRDMLMKTRRSIAGAMQTLGSLQSEGVETAPDDTNNSQSSTIDIHAVSSELSSCRETPQI